MKGKIRVYLRENSWQELGKQKQLGSTCLYFLLLAADSQGMEKNE